MSRFALVLVLLSLPLSARAEEAFLLPLPAPPPALVEPLYPPPDENVPPPETHWETIAFELELRVLYLTALEPGRGRHLGPEITLGAHVALAPSWSIVARGRVAFAFDDQTPTAELFDGGGCSSGYFFSSCAGDTDMRFPAGADLGVRVTHVVPVTHRFEVGVAAELVGSGTVYENSYEHLTRTGGLGAAAGLRIELRVASRWTIGFVAGGRLEGSLDGRGVWAGVHGGLELAIRL